MLNFTVIVVNACNKSKKMFVNSAILFEKQMIRVPLSCIFARVFGYLSLLGPRFSKVPELFGRVLDDIKRLIRKISAFRNKRIVVLQIAFRARKIYGICEKQAPVPFSGLFGLPLSCIFSGFLGLSL